MHYRLILSRLVTSRGLSCFAGHRRLAEHVSLLRSVSSYAFGGCLPSFRRCGTASISAPRAATFLVKHRADTASLLFVLVCYVSTLISLIPTTLLLLQADVFAPTAIAVFGIILFISIVAMALLLPHVGDAWWRFHQLTNQLLFASLFRPLVIFVRPFPFPPPVTPFNPLRAPLALPPVRFYGLPPLPIRRAPLPQ